MSLYFVFLRRPGTVADRRNDPFWEFGSFGRTGCHHANLLHPHRSPLSNGDRLAFIQGGAGEIRIVGFSPPISFAGSTGRIEIKWDAKYRPLPYSDAPILINNAGLTAFPEVKSLLESTKRSTWCGRAASRLRSRMTPIDSKLADQILNWFKAPGLPKIAAYHEAIAPKSARWYRAALKKGWATIDERRREYDRLNDQPQRASLILLRQGTSFKRTRSC